MLKNTEPCGTSKWMLVRSENLMTEHLNISFLDFDFVVSSHIDHTTLPYFHYLDIDHVGTQSSFAKCVMLMRSNKVETDVHGCWLFNSIFMLFGSNRVLSLLPLMPFCARTLAVLHPFYTSTFTFRCNSHLCGFVMLSHIQQLH